MLMNGNKKPRGFDDLLSHLLDKIVPVKYKLGSAKIPEYFQSQIDIRSSKTENTPTDELEHITNKTTLYTLNTFSRGSNCGPFRSTRRFRDKRSSKIGSAPNNYNLNLK